MSLPYSSFYTSKCHKDAAGKNRSELQQAIFDRFEITEEEGNSIITAHLVLLTPCLRCCVLEDQVRVEGAEN
jgi:hypothetical protein